MTVSLDLYDELTLVSASWDSTVKFWNISSGTLMQTLKTDIRVNALAKIETSKRLYLKLISTVFFANLYNLLLKKILTNFRIFIKHFSF